MTFYPQCRLIGREDRLHDRLYNLLVATAAMTIAAHYVKVGEAKFARGDCARVVCKQLELTVVLPVFGPIETALAGLYPHVIHVDFVEKEPEPIFISVWAAGINKPPNLTFGFVTATTNLIAPIFVEFFESYKGWIGNRFGPAEKWPPVWNFARVVRNSISHGGAINIVNPSAKPVSWYGLTYSHANNGRKIVSVPYPDLTMGDLVVLMFEMSDVLDELGCPFTPTHLGI